MGGSGLTTNMLVASAYSEAVVAICLIALWAVSVSLHNVAIIDVFWGPGFAIASWVSLGFSFHKYGGRAFSVRALLITCLVTVWGLRLGAYLLIRGWGRGEDKRYAAWRQRAGDWFWLKSLFVVFGAQGAILYVVAVPIFVAQYYSLGLDSVLNFGDYIGIALWAIGFCFESVGDLQLYMFKSKEINQGRVCNVGLWRYTRHPNYFGDILVWWGHYAIAASTGYGRWSVFSPIIMAFILVRVTGVTLLEDGMRGRPGFEEYVRRTSPLIPWPPKAEVNARQSEAFMRTSASSDNAQEDENGIVYDR